MSLLICSLQAGLSQSLLLFCLRVHARPDISETRVHRSARRLAIFALPTRTSLGRLTPASLDAVAPKVDTPLTEVRPQDFDDIARWLSAARQITHFGGLRLNLRVPGRPQLPPSMCTSSGAKTPGRSLRAACGVRQRPSQAGPGQPRLRTSFPPIPDVNVRAAAAHLLQAVEDSPGPARRRERGMTRICRSANAGWRLRVVATDPIPVAPATVPGLRGRLTSRRLRIQNNGVILVEQTPSSGRHRRTPAQTELRTQVVGWCLHPCDCPRASSPSSSGTSTTPETARLSGGTRRTTVRCATGKGCPTRPGRPVVTSEDGRTPASSDSPSRSSSTSSRPWTPTADARGAVE